jgi:hypothetical protein
MYSETNQVEWFHPGATVDFHPYPAAPPSGKQLFCASIRSFDLIFYFPLRVTASPTLPIRLNLCFLSCR